MRSGPTSTRWVTWAAVAALLGVSLAVRLWRLGSIPTFFFHDECDNTVNAIQILLGVGPGVYQMDWKPQPALAVNQIALTIAALGPSVMAIRLPSALLSAAALIPFILVAKRVTGMVPALLAGLLLSLNVGYLHFSRSGWENVQIVFYTLVAIEATMRAHEQRSFVWWAIAGLAAGLGALVYFAGRAIIIFLGLYGLIAIGRARAPQRLRTVLGVVIMSVAFALIVAPLVPTVMEDWDRFNTRTKTVLLTEDMPPDHTTADVVNAVGLSAWRGVATYFQGAVNNEPRYFPINRPVLDWLSMGLLVIGIMASFRFFGTTILWWLAWLIPYLMTQVMASGSPNLARGIAILPIAYLFVALGMRTIEDLVRQRPWLLSTVRAVLIVLVVLVGAQEARDYFSWASSPRLATYLHPAVELEDFGPWWELQNQWVRENRGFFNVDMWLQRRAQEAADTPRPAPTGTVYRGDVSAQPYAIDLGTITLSGGALEVTVFSVHGSDGAYDYLEATDANGNTQRVEAEDAQYTKGDRPLPYQMADNRWWVQPYDGFSGEQALLTLKNETPPPLTTRMELPPGTYTVRVGSFTGDARNGPFALQIDLHEQGVAAPPDGTPHSAHLGHTPAQGNGEKPYN